MLANGYPLPSYAVLSLQPPNVSSGNESIREDEVAKALRDMHESMKSDGWIETPEWLLADDGNHKDESPEIIAVDCEMVCGIELVSRHAYFLIFCTIVSDIGRQGAHTLLFHLFPYG